MHRPARIAVVAIWTGACVPRTAGNVRDLRDPVPSDAASPRSQGDGLRAADRGDSVDVRQMDLGKAADDAGLVATTDSAAAFAHDALPSASTDAPAAGGDGASVTGGPGNIVKTVMATRGALLFSDDFSVPGSLRSKWRLGKGQFSIEDQHLECASVPGEPAGLISHDLAADRIIMQFSFTFAGANQFGFVLNHIPAGASVMHQLNVRITRTNVSLQQYAHGASGEQVTTLEAKNIAIATSRWYTGVLELFDRHVTFAIDGVARVSGVTVDQSAFPKNRLVFRVVGQSARCDDVQIWEALPRGGGI